MTNPICALLPVPKARFFDNSGLPLVGGTLDFFQAGSLSVRQDTYTDETGATPNANPVVLDANGYANIWLQPLAYKIVLKDSLGVQIWVEDNVSAIGIQSIATTTTAGLVQLATPAETVIGTNNTKATTPLDVATAINPTSYANKATVAQNDQFMIADSAAANALKHVTLAELETQLETDLTTFINGLITAANGGAGQTSQVPPAFSALFQSVATSFAAQTVLSVPHGLTDTPSFVWAYLVCTAPDGGYIIGDKIPVSAFASANSGGRALWYDATNIHFLHKINPYGDIIAPAVYAAGGSGTLYQINASKWQVVLSAAVINASGAVGSTLLGTGSIDTSASSGLLDLRTPVPNDTYAKVIIEISNLISTGGAGAGHMDLKFAQQGTINSASNYNSTSSAGGAFTSGNFNQAPGVATRLIANFANDLSDGGGTLTLYNFCKTTRKPARLTLDMVAYTSNAVIANQVATSGFGQIWGSGGDDTKVTDGLSFIATGATKFTFDYRIYGIK